MPRTPLERRSAIDVNELNRLGAFRGVPMHFPFMMLWTSRYLVEFRSPRWPLDRPSQRIPVQWTWCSFGGPRPWLTCLCGRRVGKLYFTTEFYGCRECCNLTYQSRTRGRQGRLHLKATRIRQRMWDDGRPGIDPIPPRRSGMHRKTYARLKARLQAAENKLSPGYSYRPRPRRRRRY